MRGPLALGLTLALALVAVAASAEEKPRSVLSRDVCYVKPKPPAPPPPPPPPPPPAPEDPAAVGAPSPDTITVEEPAAIMEFAGETADFMRRRLYRTACAANLWLDGLFGGTPNVGAASDITGRVELSAIDQSGEGMKYRGKAQAEFELPNLEGRFKAFIGRDDQDDFVEDRQEGFALRSSLFGLESEDKWLAGLGYGLPGRYFTDSDVRVGVKIKEEPEIFTQARYRKNFFRGERTAWRFRETLFWKSSRDGAGSTTSLDWDRMLAESLLLRWGNVGTVSQSTEGMAWRSVVVLYQNLSRESSPRARAIAYETFVRGSTDAVLAGEYGLRLIYRQNILREFLFAEVIAGYSWRRQEEEDRKGSETIGFGLEMAFGR